MILSFSAKGSFPGDSGSQATYLPYLKVPMAETFGSAALVGGTGLVVSGIPSLYYSRVDY